MNRKATNEYTGNLLPDAALTLSLRVLAVAAQVLTFILIVRTHSMNDVGLVALMTTSLFLARLLGPLGFDQAALKYCSQFISVQDLRSVSGFAALATKSLINIVIPLSAILALTSLVAWSFLPDYETQLYCTIATALGIPAFAGLGLLSALHRSRAAIVWAQVPDGLLIHFIAAVGIGTAYLIGVLDVWFTLALQAIAGWIAFGATYLRWRSFLANTEADLANEKKSEIIAMSREVFKLTFLTNTALRIPIFIVSFLLGGAATALLEAAQRFGWLSTITTFASNMAAAPLIAKAVANGNKDDEQNIITLASLLQTLPAAGLLVFLVLFGDPLLVWMFGQPYSAAYWPMVLLALMSFINALGGVASPYLMMRGGERFITQFSFARLIIVLFAVPVAAYFGGLVAVCTVIVIGTIVRDLGLTYFAANRFGLRPGVLSLVELRRLPTLLTQELGRLIGDARQWRRDKS